MASRRFGEAYEVFRQPLQAVIACFGTPIVTSKGPRRPGEQYDLAMSDVLKLPGQSSGDPLSIELALRYRIAPGAEDRRGWEIQTTAYSYWLRDHDERELLVFQWDPSGPSPVKRPHLHVGKGLAHPALTSDFRDLVGRLSGAHFATGFVALSTLLRTTVDDLGVIPLRPVTEVTRLLDAADAVFHASCQWFGAGT